MAAALIDIATTQGRAAGERWTLVPSPLAELSERSGRGRNCGTVYAHVRTLRDVGAVRRPVAQTGLLLDLRALAGIAQHGASNPNPSPTRAARGYSRPGVEPRTSRIDPDQQGPVDPHATEITEVLAVLRQVLGLLERILDRNTASRPELCDISQRLGHLAEIADSPREGSRMVRDVAEAPRDTDRREGGRILTNDAAQILPPSLKQPDLRDLRDDDRPSRNVAEVAESTGGTPVGERGTNQGLRDDELDDLLVPLVELSKRANLVGVTDIDEARSAIRPFSAIQIAQAVAMTAAMTRNGTVRSPIGWLVTKARQGDSNFFRPEQPQVPPRTVPAASGVPDADGLETKPDAEAEAAVTALECDPENHHDALDQLDKKIISALGTAIAERVTADPTSRHVTRVNFWRPPHPPSAEKEP